MSDRPVRDLSGALFKNDKGGNDARPDYRGDITIGGVTYRLSAWLKTSANGNKYMSLSATPQEGQEQPQRAAGGSGYAPRTRTPGEYPEPSNANRGPKRAMPADLDQDIPF